MSEKNSKLKNGRIVVGMSGGVDSAYAAAILKKDGHDVIGMTFRMWPKDECGSSTGRACCSLEAITRARAVCEKLKMPHYVVDVSEEFRKEIIDYFCQEYIKGLTPNPCVLCNEKIKFGVFLEKARSLGAEMMATGHYAKLEFDKQASRYILREGRDKSKDQSYFLFSLSQGQFGYTLFPLGDMTKETTRKLALAIKLPAYNAPSSQDVCFVSDLRYADFIKKKTGLEVKSGDILDTAGKVIGRHKGTIFYTIGQRRGLGIAHKEPLYVTAIDVAANRIVAGTKKDVLKKSFIAEGLNWIAVKDFCGTRRVMVKIRYNHKKAPASIMNVDEGVRVDFDEPQEAPTPGQAAVFYDKDTVLGGGWIKKVL